LSSPSSLWSPTPSELLGAEISRRLSAEQITPDHDLGALPQLDEPPADDHGAEGERSLASMYEPIDWHALWATTSDEPDWLVPDVVERGRLHAIYAPKKHKKSLLTLVIVASLVTGRPLLGRPNPHARSLRVLYVDVENSRDDIRQRLQDAGYGPADLENLVYLSFPSLPGLDSAAGGQHLVALVQHYKPDLVVLDTTSRVVVGKENDADTFRSLYRHALAPIKARGIAVLRLDHAGKDPTLGQRGSSAKGDDLDTACC
jgi:RecA-family ATPase